MRILMAFLFVMLGGVSQAATIVDEKLFQPVAITDDDFEEYCTSVCTTSWYSDTKFVLGIPMVFDVPLGKRLASAKIDYTLFFIGVGVFDQIDFNAFGYIQGPLRDYYPEVFPQLTSASPVSVSSNSIRLHVAGSTRPQWESNVFTSFDIGGTASAIGRTVSEKAMRVGIHYKLTYKTAPLAPVPLPASGVGMLLALAGLVLAARRRA